MTRNTLSDLNNHLFEQLERLQDDELDFDKEAARADKMVDVGKTIVENGKLILNAHKFGSEYGIKEVAEVPRMLE